MHMLWNKNKNLSRGQIGENFASGYLKKKGYKILETNFCNTSGRRLGEIDIIAKDKSEVVFVEVKTRKLVSADEVLPEEAIDRRKLHKLNKAAQFYIRKNNLWDAQYRFDAVSVWIDGEEKNAKVKHLKSIFI